MDERFLLRLVDYVSAAAIGLCSALLPSLVVPHGWNMWGAMFTGMVLAMLAAFFIANFLARLAGPFEIAMPGMVISMTVGMMPMHGTGGYADAALFGAAAGVAIQAGFHLYDIYLHGEVKSRESAR
jgi:hypothetical protein